MEQEQKHDSRYAKKCGAQIRGIYSPTSPFNPDPKYRNKPAPVPFHRGVNFFKPIKEDNKKGGKEFIDEKSNH